MLNSKRLSIHRFVLINLDDYLKKWNLRDPFLLEKTPTSHVYKVKSKNNTFVLKLLTTLGVEDETNGAIALKYFDGIGSVSLIEHDSSAHLLEYADGTNLKQLVKNGQDKKATEIIAQTVLKLQSNRRKPIPNKLTPLKVRFQSLTNRPRDDLLIFEKAKILIGKLLDNLTDEVVLHGDIHHENILFSQNRGWLAIDPKGLLGEKTYELANTLMNPTTETTFVQSKQSFTDRVETLEKVTGFCKKRIIAYAFTHTCLSACWTIESGKDPCHSLAMAKIIEPLLD